jgi:hypothetical protein
VSGRHALSQGEKDQLGGGQADLSDLHVINANVVMSHNEHDWYDIRRMTEDELEDFVRASLRAERALLQSGLILPH